MKKKIILIMTILFLSIIILLGYHFYKEYRIKNEKKIVELKTTEIEVFTKLTVKDLIQEINGTLLTNPKINTTTIGVQEVTFSYKTGNNIKVPYTIHLNIVDKTPPLIDYPGTYQVEINTTTKKELQESFFCGDNYDDKPKCTIEGDYNLNEEGEYNVSLKGEDSSGNISENSFLLKVKNPSKNSSNKENNTPIKTISFEEIREEHKKNNTTIGIDISHWQGNIDFKKLKQSNVEFAYIRVGRRDDVHGKIVEDDKFEEYIKGLNKVNIPVGIYFYSKASNQEEIKEEVQWIIKKIKKYKVDLEVVIDWENWDNYQKYHLSFYHLSEIAETFSKEIQKQEYESMLYSSKYYLENIWFPVNTNIWLAHYTKQTNYEKPYKVWQICNNGKVSGIDDNQVDIDIRYETS